MKVVTPEQMRKLDKIAMEQYGIPGAVLMENAGRRIAKEAVKLSGGGGKPMVLIAGKGNNGGDVMVAARHLFNNNVPIRMFLLGKPEDLKGDAGINAGILTRMGIPIETLASAEDLASLGQALKWGHVVVDGIFGTGFRGEVEGLPLEVIRAVNQSGCTVVSMDIPSGMDGETGRICGECIRASITVTFGFPKAGFFQYPGAGCAGRLVVADISIPRCIAPESGPDMTLLTGEYVSGIIPDRRPDAHKGSYGRAAVIGGSEGMTGAVVLSSLGCIKSGAGLVRAALPGALNYVLENRVIEAMSVPLGEGTQLKLDGETEGRLKKVLDWADAIVLGPGMGVDDDRVRLTEFVLANARVPLVLDADALNCLALDMGLLKRAAGPVVLTPHPGEMARLTGMGIDEIQHNRIGAARAFAEKWGTVTVLKGANSVIAHPVGNIYINTSGNPGMASGGSGDVLAGIIASFAAQGLDPVKAACAAVYIHGRAGDLLAEEKGVYGLTATGLADCIPIAIKSVKEG